MAEQRIHRDRRPLTLVRMDASRPIPTAAQEDAYVVRYDVPGGDVLLHVERLVIYHSEAVLDGAVPDEWLRLTLATLA